MTDTGSYADGGLLATSYGRDACVRRFPEAWGPEPVAGAAGPYSLSSGIFTSTIASLRNSAMYWVR
jgi:hypothetical protein